MKELLELLSSMKDLDPKVKEKIEAKAKETEKAIIGRNSRENKKAIADAVEEAKKELAGELEETKKKVETKNTDLTKLQETVKTIQDERAKELFDNKFKGSGIDPKYKEFVKGQFKDNFEEALKEFPEWKQKEKVVLNPRTIVRPTKEGETVVSIEGQVIQGT